MQICVGAVSRRVIEVAAELQVPQIIASRRQVNHDGGYTGFTNRELVDYVGQVSPHTLIVRDHGGPGQDGTPVEIDNDLDELKRDRDAGFHILHVDVSKLPYKEQVRALTARLSALQDIDVEVGGEHDSHWWNMQLLEAALDAHNAIVHAIIQTGGWIREDRQAGFFNDPKIVEGYAIEIHQLGVRTKSHNQDWSPLRHSFTDSIDACNIAPEFGAVEVDAILQVTDFDTAKFMLSFAYESGAWTRWFNPGTGTFVDRAKCAMRYLLSSEALTPYVNFFGEKEEYVRERIRNAIQCA